MKKYANVLSPIKMGNLVLKSRFVSGNSLPHFLQGPESYPSEQVIGHVIVYDHGCVRRACVFRPNEEMCRALEERLLERFGFDERMTHAFVRTLYSRALHRAFPALHPYVDPLVKPEDVQWAKEELEARKAHRKEKAEAKVKEQEKAKAEKEKKAEAKKKRGKTKANKNEKANDAKEAGAEETPRRRRKQG